MYANTDSSGNNSSDLTCIDHDRAEKSVRTIDNKHNDNSVVAAEETWLQQQQ